MNWFQGWANLPPNVRKASKWLAAAIVISLGLVAVSYLIAHWGYGAKYPDDKPERLIAFLDAVLAGIVAFALLGAFTFLVSIRRPEEEAIDDRVAFLYSARREESPASNAYLKDQVMLLGATVKHAKQCYSFVEIGPGSSYVKVIVTMEMHLINMMKHDSYSQVTPLKIGQPNLEGLPEEMGFVHYVRTSSSNGSNTFAAPVSVLLQPFRFTREQKDFELDVPLAIPPGGELRYEYMFECLCPASDVHKCGANRFVEEMDMTIRNLTEREIRIVPPQSVDPRLHRTVEQSFTLGGRGGEQTLKFRALPPTQDVVIETVLC